MNRLIRHTEQLQLAGAFLHEKGQQYARLSLILCDNVVELLAHEQCELNLLKEAQGWGLKKLSKSEREHARGRVFVPKINLLVKLGDIEADERDLATRAHTLRNECYHTAAMHQEIAWQVAWEYHELACTLFGRLRQWGYVIGGVHHQSEATKAILDGAGFNGEFPVDFGKALTKLLELLRSTKPPPQAPLNKVLAAAAERRFTRLTESIDFIAHDGLETDSRDDAIREAYFRATLDTDALEAGIDTQTPQGIAVYFQRHQEIQAKYVSPLRFSAVTRWMNRANAIAEEATPSKALVKYMDLRRDSEEAAEIIHEQARLLDDAIQLQIAIARGK